MKRTLSELMDDTDKVLVNRGDLYMLLHTVTQFFYQNEMSEEWVTNTMSSLCARNRFPESFADSYQEFLNALNEEAEKDPHKFDALDVAHQHGFDSIDDLIDFMNGNGGPES